MIVDQYYGDVIEHIGIIDYTSIMTEFPVELNMGSTLISSKRAFA